MTGYWDTSGYCHWSKNAQHNELEFELSEEESLKKAIAQFLFDNPSGEYSIYKIKEIDYYSEEQDLINNLGTEARKLALKLEIDHNIKEKAAKKLQQQESLERQKRLDLEKLQELKEKYES